MTEDVHDCPLCDGRTSTSICANCASSLEALGAKLPSPDATPEEVAQWARENGVTAFSCGRK